MSICEHWRTRCSATCTPRSPTLRGRSNWTTDLIGMTSTPCERRCSCGLACSRKPDRISGVSKILRSRLKRWPRSKSCCTRSDTDLPAAENRSPPVFTPVLVLLVNAVTTAQVDSVSALQARIDAARPGEVITVKDGTYTTTGPITVKAHGADGK